MQLDRKYSSISLKNALISFKATYLFIMKDLQNQIYCIYMCVAPTRQTDFFHSNIVAKFVLKNMSKVQMGGYPFSKTQNDDLASFLGACRDTMCVTSDTNHVRHVWQYHVMHSIAKLLHCCLFRVLLLFETLLPSTAAYTLEMSCNRVNGSKPIQKRGGSRHHFCHEYVL